MFIYTNYLITSMKDTKKTKIVSFEVEIIEEYFEQRVTVSPSDKFIEGCLIDLKDSHGLDCKKVVIKTKQQRESTQNSEYISAIRYAFTDKEWINQRDLVNFVANKIKKHEKAVYRKIKELAIGENRIIELDTSEGRRHTKVFIVNASLTS